MLLNGHVPASLLLDSIKDEIKKISPQRPLLAVVLVGENPASIAYVNMKKRRAHEVGMDFVLKKYPQNITEHALKQIIKNLSSDINIHGLIVQAPLPKHINTFSIIESISPEKDVDGFTRTQIGNMFLGHDGLWSCTPKGIMTLLKHYNIDLVGKKVAIIGRSNIVGKPMALMLINAGATVFSCNSYTRDISTITQDADIVIIAIGKPKWLTRDMVQKNSIIVDVGSNLLDDGSFCGDTDYENLTSFVSAISPSPGGVGPMTVATLIANVWHAYKQQNNLI